MLTDVFFAEHTMIDPHTDAIQIIGRFRKWYIFCHAYKQYQQRITTADKGRDKRLSRLLQGDI